MFSVEPSELIPLILALLTFGGFTLYVRRLPKNARHTAKNTAWSVILSVLFSLAVAVLVFGYQQRVLKGRQFHQMKNSLLDELQITKDALNSPVAQVIYLTDSGKSIPVVFRSVTLKAIATDAAVASNFFGRALTKRLLSQSLQIGTYNLTTQLFLAQVNSKNLGLFRSTAELLEKRSVQVSDSCTSLIPLIEQLECPQ